SLPYIRYAAICLIIKADKEKMYFSSNKTGGNNKKLHIINELKKYQGVWIERLILKRKLN
ncbi:hypothetical protein, partial [Serratia fonticola]